MNLACNGGNPGLHVLQSVLVGVDSMKPQIFRIVPISPMPIGEFRSAPAQVGVTDPLYPVPRLRHAVHPQEMSGTVEFGFGVTEPGNDSSLALGCVPGSPVAQEG